MVYFVATSLSKGLLPVVMYTACNNSSAGPCQQNTKIAYIVRTKC